MAQTIPPEIAAENAADDLTKVVGIGPAVEQHLRKAGITHFSQLAKMKPKKLASLLNDMRGFTEERITTQDWLGQAQRLAAEAGELQPVGDAVAIESSENSKHRQHYAVFTCELLLDRLNQVRRTRVMHVQSQQEIAWAGWVPGKLEGFLTESAQLNIAKLTDRENPAAPVHDQEPAVDLTPETPTQILPQTMSVLHGVPRIHDFQLHNVHGEKLGVLIPAGKSFNVQLVLDLQQVTVDTGERLRYAAELFAKNMENNQRLEVSRNEGLLDLDDLSCQIEIHSQPLPLGDYTLDVVVTLWPQSQAYSLRNQLSALIEGIWVNCYESGF